MAALQQQQRQQRQQRQYKQCAAMPPPRVNPTDIYFLAAWKRGVSLVGESLFGCQAATPTEANHWRQLTPKLDLMRKAIGNKTQSEAFLIAVMASFYNDIEGQKMMNKTGITFGLAASISRDYERAIITDLITFFRAWKA
jgi:hypothetical protein